MHNLQFYVSGKRPIDPYLNDLIMMIMMNYLYMVYDHCYTCHFKRKMSSLWLNFHYLLQQKLSTWSLYQNCRIPLSIYYNNFSIFLLCKIYLPSITTPTNSNFFLQKYVFWPYRLYDVWHRHLLGSGWYPTWKILSMGPLYQGKYVLFVW